MSTILFNNSGFSEKELEKNWAARYAKRLHESLSDKLNDDVAALKAADDDIIAAHAADKAELK
ncbi:MAG: hypothetical protein PUD92_00045, partial [Clostridiales bacterium]|nr:hypothetical protein [Clostridiales bacterium]